MPNSLQGGPLSSYYDCLKLAMVFKPWYAAFLILQPILGLKTIELPEILRNSIEVEEEEQIRPQRRINTQLLTHNLTNPTRATSSQNSNIPQPGINKSPIAVNQHLTGANSIPLGENNITEKRPHERPPLLPTPPTSILEKPLPQRDPGWTVAGRQKKSSRWEPRPCPFTDPPKNKSNREESNASTKNTQSKTPIAISTTFDRDNKQKQKADLELISTENRFQNLVDITDDDEDIDDPPPQNNPSVETDLHATTSSTSPEHQIPPKTIQDKNKTEETPHNKTETSTNQNSLAKYRPTQQIPQYQGAKPKKRAEERPKERLSMDPNFFESTLATFEALSQASLSKAQKIYEQQKKDLFLNSSLPEVKSIREEQEGRSKNPKNKPQYTLGSSGNTNETGLPKKRYKHPTPPPQDSDSENSLILPTLNSQESLPDLTSTNTTNKRRLLRSNSRLE